MTRPLDGKSAVVTGASSGIGAATARHLARDGANVALAARRKQHLVDLREELEDEFDVEAAAVPTDVREEVMVEELVETAVDRFGGLDVLVNNAGLARGSSVEDLSTDEYRLMMDTNVDGMFFATRAALPHVRESEGTIVFIGSFAGQYPRPFNPVYAATKWWTRGFAHSVAAQVGDEGVAVSVINPAAVRTEFEVPGSGDLDGSGKFKDRFAPGEAVEPEEVAEAVAYVARQSPSMVSELDLYNRDKLTLF
ncbi:SDR family oxidoreductase [Halomarina litorea]|uniref:SDR family oxidoreductase n=1 Tax=Halomarina litorea TaxID=2961595 RepID=UPI0020C49A54|nr:SDR family oxidoreductase [Halomarina sp. BCD28]